MFTFSKVLPKVANNELDSPKIAIWAFMLFTALMTWRSIVHMFFETWGLHGIANFIVLTGDPDPMPVIYQFFSLWGATQLLFCFVCWAVVFRYKSLIPLMSLFWVVDWSLRFLISDDITTIGVYTTSNTPGADGAPIALAVTVIIFLLSIANKKNKFL